MGPAAIPANAYYEERNPSEKGVQYQNFFWEQTMELLTKLQNDMKIAMKAGDKARLGVIRMLISDVKVIDMQPNKPTEEQAVESYAKKLRKSIEEYAKLGKAAEVAQLQAEVAVVDEYLPKKASPGETAIRVDAFLASNAFTEQQIGRATGAFMKVHGSQVDPAIASQLIKEKLSKPA